MAFRKYLGIGILAFSYCCMQSSYCPLGMPERNRDTTAASARDEALQIFAKAKKNCESVPYIYAVEKSSYIILPKEKALLCIKFEKDSDYEFINMRENYALEEIVSRGIDMKRNDDSIFGDSLYIPKTKAGAIGLYFLKPGFSRDLTGKGNAHGASRSLEDYLKDSDNLQVHSPLVEAAAIEAVSEIPEPDRKNPYLAGKAIASWIYKNIKYSTIPARYIERAAAIIASLPDDKKNDVSLILSKSIKFNEAEKMQQMQKIAAEMPIPEIGEPYKMAEEILNEFNKRWAILSVSWDTDTEFSSEYILEKRRGKCVHMSSLFVAMCRNRGIAARAIGGYAVLSRTTGGYHNWSAAYIPGIGWKEVDVTWDEFDDFTYSAHAYEFSFDPKFKSSIISEETCTDEAFLNECRALLEQEP